MEKKDVSRRGFIKGLTATGLLAAGAATLTGCDLGSSNDSLDWKEEADVVVIGSGFAGLAAALEAIEAGSTVKVIEKMAFAGGNSTINGGDFAAAGTKMQAEAGIKDSPELMLEDMLKAGGKLNHVEKTRMVAEKSNEALEWTMNYLGVKFARVNFHGGHSVPRAHQCAGASGSDIIKAMLSKLKGKNVEVELNKKVTRLIADENGRVIGLEARDGYQIGDEESGTPVLVKAKKAVVLASGGFSGDVEMRAIHDPRITKEFTTTNHQGATGEVLREACKLGAMDVQMDWIQLGPWTSPDEKGFGYVPQFCERIVGWSPMIDPKTGKRFINETGNRKVRADAIMEIGEPVIIVGDTYAVEHQVLPQILEGAMKNGSVKKYNSLEEVAKAYNIPVQPFLAEMEHWNSLVLAKKDPDFECKIFADAKPTVQAPFYVSKLWPKVHHTMGGLVTNAKGQVTNQDFKPIAGLYAAGEVTGGTHGEVRLGSCALTDCVVFGRITGQEAAKETAWA